ncbi:M16 family metallopeptidase [Candidatus Omnitrophota bacterium]
MYKKKRLGNGARIVVYPMKEKRSAALGIWIKVGGRYESRNNKGIAHVLEHLLFKGSKKYSCSKIKQSLEGVGGALNGFTSEELTCYLVKLPARHLDMALEVLSDMVINPLIDKAELEREKTVILEEIKMYKDLPQMYVHELLDELLWPNQPLGEPIIGSVESVSATTRESLMRFKENHYTPSNMVISAAGDLKFDKFTQKVSRIFSQLAEANLNKFANVEENQSKPQLKLLHKHTEQTHLSLGFHSLRRNHPDKYALALLHIILGANMSSRLFNEIREKRGLAYNIGTQVKAYEDTGIFGVRAGIDNTKIAQTVALILKELKKIKEALVSDDEFHRAKEFYLGQFMLGLEDTQDHMLWIGETTVSLDKTYTIDDIVKEVNKVRREDLERLANDIFFEGNLNLALIGPLKESEKKIHSGLHLD